MGASASPRGPHGITIWGKINFVIFRRAEGTNDRHFKPQFVTYGIPLGILRISEFLGTTEGAAVLVREKEIQ